MIFDFTHGKPVRYMMMIYFQSGQYDRVLYGTYRNAKAGYIREIEKPHTEGTSVSLYDVELDIRIEYTKF